jgi:hypothetical protein
MARGYSHAEGHRRFIQKEQIDPRHDDAVAFANDQRGVVVGGRKSSHGRRHLGSVDRRFPADPPTLRCN